MTDDFYESDLLGAVGEMLAPGDLVVDVGANVGNHTVFFALVKGCKVFSFEPNPAALLYLRANVLHNTIASLVHVKPFAVGESKGRAGVLSENAGNLGAMALKLDAQSGAFEVVCLDDQDFPAPIRLLKIDVEGMEVGVLKGAKALIEKDRPYIVVEAGTAAEFAAVDSILNASRYLPIAVFGATATYFYAPAERYAGLSAEILVGIRNAVISEAAQKQLFLEHRETRKTVIKHSQQLTDVRDDIAGLRPELESRFIKAADDLQKVREDIHAGMSSIRSELVTDRDSSARDLQAEISSERGSRAEELRAAIREERELRAKEVQVALAEERKLVDQRLAAAILEERELRIQDVRHDVLEERRLRVQELQQAVLDERKVVAQEIEESVSAERTARIQEVQSAVLKERELRAKELQEAELADRALRAQEIQAAILRERELAIQELQSALRQEREARVQELDAAIAAGTERHLRDASVSVLNERRLQADALQAAIIEERGLRQSEMVVALHEERGATSEEIRSAVRAEHELLMEEVRAALVAEREVTSGDLRSAVSTERELRISETHAALEDEREAAAHAVHEAVARQHQQVILALQNELQVERESRSKEVSSAISQERERLMAAMRAEIDQERIQREKDLRLELDKERAFRKTELQAALLEQRKSMVEESRAELSSERRLGNADLETLRTNIHLDLEQINSRISHLNQRHEALLNGRIFKTLTNIKSLVLRRKQDPDAVPMLTWAPADEVSALVPEAEPVVLQPAAAQPEALPVAKKAEVEVSPRARMERPIDILVAGSIELAAEPMVSIVMTTYNAETTVVDAVQSILDQTYRKLELVIVDDASSDRTLAKLWQMAAKDKRIRIIESPHNRGTYWAKNTGIVASRGDVVTFMDSDDVVDATRIEKQLGHICGPGVVGTTCNYIRKNESGEIVLNRGLEQRIGLITLMLKRKVFDEIGYFDSVRTSADDEMMQRVKLVYGRRSVVNVAEPLYIAKLRENSLTTMAGNANNLAATTASAFLSDARAGYVEAYSLWHKMVSSSGRAPYVPFPNVNRPFAVAGKLRVDEDRFEAQPIIAFMASFPPRLEKLKLAVASILPQVDRLYIYLNGFDSVPQFLKDERIVVKTGGKDLRDNGKIFHMANSPEGYYLTVDDDIAYPPDYCEVLVRAVERYDRKAVVGVHGVTLAQPFVKYFSPDRTVYSFKHVLHKDVRVNLLGTGTVAFHSATIRPQLNQFESTGMADVWMAILAKAGSVPMISVARPANWLQPILMAGEGDTTLYDEFRENDSAQTEALKRHGSWVI
ncbi:FkbM family methyltransferase [Stenotrophomonas sp. PS02298]|uniref:FkbM family methyltransferase n=1 Tax=Stenotrophomonas sp. PS02298 TaxID=2991424 RepID=UPI00249B5466|nr:FkbM family methyltransferase [Stenotrophomonas sp. PS02298]